MFLNRLIERNPKLLATALETSGRGSRELLAASARENGNRLGQSAMAGAGRRPSQRRLRGEVLDLLVNHGYEPYMTGRDIYMRNCPFHTLSRDHRELVCAANHALMVGLTSTVEAARLSAAYEPAEGRCCVVLHPLANAANC